MSEPFDPQILDLLLRRYTPGEEQKCRLCGRPMRHYQDVGLDLRSYRCTMPPSTSLGSLVTWMRHLQDSDLTVNRKPDPEVIVLVKAYRELAARQAKEEA